MMSIKKIAVFLTTSALMLTSIPYSAFATEELTTDGTEGAIISEESENSGEEDSDFESVEETDIDFAFDEETDLVDSEESEDIDTRDTSTSVNESLECTSEQTEEENLFTDGTENELVLTNEDWIELVSTAQNNDAPYSATTEEKLKELAPGSYSITANVFVPGEDNKKLPGVTAYLTNPKYPFASDTTLNDFPTKPQYYNAILNVSENKEITLSIELKNPIFQALQIGSNEESTVIVQNVSRTTDGSDWGKEDTYKKYVPDAEEGKYRIQTVTLKLNDYSGNYKFGNCTEYATILQAFNETAEEQDYIWNVALGLKVDFDSIGQLADPDLAPTYFSDDTLGLALEVDGKLEEGTTGFFEEITSGDVYSAIKKYMEENVVSVPNSEMYPSYFKVFYVGLKDNAGNNVSNMKNYRMTLFSESGERTFGYSVVGNECMFRWVDGGPTTQYTSQSAGDAKNGGKFPDSEMTDFYQWESGEFPGGYVVLYTKTGLLYEHTWSNDDTGIEITYGNANRAGSTHVSETQATIIYNIKSFKDNVQNQNNEALLTLIKEKSEYSYPNILTTYRLALYNMKNGMKKNDAIELEDNQTSLKIALPVEKDSTLYKVIYDEATQSYKSVDKVEFTLSADGKAQSVVFERNAEWDDKILAIQRLYESVDDTYRGGKSRNTQQFYVLVSDGTTEKPSVDTTEFNYDGTAKTLGIPESSHYTISDNVSETLNGNYKTTVTLNDGYVWADGSTDPLTFEWKINALKVDKPAAVNGLVYNGKAQTGVTKGTGYELTGTYQATNAGSYKATVLLADGYEWSDGSSDSVALEWTIAKANQKITAKVGSKSYKLADLKKKKASFTIGAKASGKVTYKVQSAPSSNAKKYISVNGSGKVTMAKGAPAGTYKVRVSAASTSNYNAATKDVKITVKKATQKITAKVSSKSYKASSLKKQKASFTIGASAKGKLSYKVTSTPSKKAAKYISVNSKGKVTMKKGAPKGTYKITVTAKATSAYNSATKTVKVVVK